MKVFVVSVMCNTRSLNSFKYQKVTKNRKSQFIISNIILFDELCSKLSDHVCILDVNRLPLIVS